MEPGWKLKGIFALFFFKGSKYDNMLILYDEIISVCFIVLLLHIFSPSPHEAQGTSLLPPSPTSSYF